MRTLLLGILLASSVSLAQAVPAPQLPSLSPLIESVKGAVVAIDIAKRPSEENLALLQRFSRRGGPTPDMPLNQGTGSGFIIDSKGLVLTNNHVVEGAVTLKVRLDDGRAFDGEILGRDPLTDVALVKLKHVTGTLPAVKLGDSGAMKIGDWVVAIGNPFGLSQSVSTGIISASDRQIGASRYDQFLQTDAAINPGNSGGPLFSLKGDVIGMNTAIVQSGTGIGFAVPSNVIKAIIPQLEKTGTVTRGWLGVGIQDLTPALAKALGVPQKEGALVTSVNAGSPAQKAGLQDEDVVTAIDAEKVTSSGALTRIIALKRPEATVALAVVRAGKPTEVKVKLGIRPDLENIGDTRPATQPGEETHKLGISFQDMDPRLADGAGLPRNSALVIGVTPGSAADEAGFMRGMAIVELNRKPINGRDELASAFKGLKPGAVALFRVALPGTSTRQLVALEVP